MEKKTKVLFVLYSQAYSGAEINIVRLIKGCKSFVEPVILCSEGLFAENLRNDGFTIHTNKGLSSLHRYKKNYFQIVVLLVKKIISLNYRCLLLFRKHEIEIIQTNNLLAGSYLLPAILLLNITGSLRKCFWYNQDIYYQDKIKGFLLKHLCLILYSKTFVLSEASRSTYIIFKRKITILPGGLNGTEIKRSVEIVNKIRNLFGMAEGKIIIIGIFGPISERKGHHLLIEAFRRLYNENSNLRLLILGELKFTPLTYEKQLSDQLKHLDSSSYRIEKWTSEVWNYYGAIDILVNATTSELSEAFGNTIVEAMACGKIVVAARTGGIPEIVEHNVNGFLFPPDDVEQLTNTLRYVINNYDQFGEIRTNAVAKVNRDYSIEKIVAKYKSNILDEEH